MVEGSVTPELPLGCILYATHSMYNISILDGCFFCRQVTRTYLGEIVDESNEAGFSHFLGRKTSIAAWQSSASLEGQGIQFPGTLFLCWPFCGAHPGWRATWPESWGLARGDKKVGRIGF